MFEIDFIFCPRVGRPKTYALGKNCVSFCTHTSTWIHLSLLKKRTNPKKKLDNFKWQMNSSITSIMLWKFDHVFNGVTYAFGANISVFPLFFFSKEIQKKIIIQNVFLDACPPIWSEMFSCCFLIGARFLVEKLYAEGKKKSTRHHSEIDSFFATLGT